MSLRFLLGRSGSGKTESVLNEIKHSLSEDPNGPPIVYVVPDQMTFLSEYTLISSGGPVGMVRAQVYSFTRLALRVLQETGGISRYHLNDTGLSMLIRKIIEERKEDLRIFSKASDKIGFVQHVESMMKEFKRYCLTPEELKEQGETFENNDHSNKALADKMHDLQMIYSDFEYALIHKYIDSEDYFRLLSEGIKQSSWVKHAEIFVDGFYGFTPQEYEILLQLMKTCRRVTITLTLEQAYRNQHPDELEHFRMSGETYATIYELASQNGVTIEDDKKMERNYRHQSDSLAFLEEQFEKRPARMYKKDTDIQLFEAGNRRAEIEGIAREIRYLTRDKGYRYKDIAILVRNGPDYQELLETIFYDYQIPYFIDQKRSMVHHPLIEFIRSSLDILSLNWRYESVFRAVKTDLFFPIGVRKSYLREQMDRLENYVLAYGIKGDKWTRKDRWEYRRIRGLEFSQTIKTSKEIEVEEELDRLRTMVVEPLSSLEKKCKRATTGREIAEAIYLYMENLQVPQKLEILQQEAEERGELIIAREHGQAWDAMITLLDQFVEMLDDEPITLNEAIVLLESGMEAMKFSLVPPAIDQVFVANLELSRLSSVKAAFVIGVNDQVLPLKMKEDGILADSDREILLSKGVTLAPSAKKRLQDEDFIAYKAFTTPSERLYVTYPVANEDGKTLIPSPYVKRLGDMFPNAKRTMIPVDASELEEKDQLSFISHPEPTLAFLTFQLQMKIREYPIYDIWWDAYHYYMNNEKWKEPASLVLSSLFYANQTKPLLNETTKELYGENIVASVSRMEKFHSCAFSHFASHGLKLKERKVFRLAAPDIGDLFHSALKWMFEEVIKRGWEWAQLDSDQCLKLAHEAVEYLSPLLQNQILLSSNRHLYIKRKLEQIIGRTSIILSRQARASGFVPVGLELGFGPKEKLHPFTFSLKNGMTMELAGRIDRVDEADQGSDVFLRVVDYKSSPRDLDLSEVYYGLALQMLTYLDVVISNSKKLTGKEAVPAGVLYFHVHNPVINSKKILTMEEIEEAIMKSFKMKGLILDDTEVVQLMDHSLENGNSNIVSAGLKKDGSLTARSKVASKEEFESMRHYVRKMYKQSGDKIANGDVQIDPYKLKDKVPCTFCSYRTVCQFDPSLETNEYRFMHAFKPEEAIDAIRTELNEND